MNNIFFDRKLPCDRQAPRYHTRRTLRRQGNPCRYPMTDLAEGAWPWTLLVASSAEAADAQTRALFLEFAPPKPCRLLRTHMRARSPYRLCLGRLGRRVSWALAPAPPRKLDIWVQPGGHADGDGRSCPGRLAPRRRKRPDCRTCACEGGVFEPRPPRDPGARRRARALPDYDVRFRGALRWAAAA
jgi:hypothetical protein